MPFIPVYGPNIGYIYSRPHCPWVRPCRRTDNGRPVSRRHVFPIALRQKLKHNEHSFKPAWSFYTLSKTLCMIPWLHRFTNEEGLQLACCTGMGDDNQLRDDNGRALHVSQHLTDEQVLNSPVNKAMRVAMMNGEWPAVCERCRRSEEAGAISIRQHVNSRFSHREKEALSHTGADGTLQEAKVRYADIRLGNTCNLTCRMCWPSASARWIRHYNQVQPKNYRWAEATLDRHRKSWVKRESAEWLIRQSLATLESLHFAGGEPLIIPEMPQLLEICIRSGRADQIDLSYNTNVTELPARVTKLWSHFRSVSLYCSVDGFGTLNEYIRRPSRWVDIDRNFQLLDQHFLEWKLRTVLCCTTVQLYNILQLGELFDYLATGFSNITPVPQLLPLYDPFYLSIRHLPADVKEAARKMLIDEKTRAESLEQPGQHVIGGQIDTIIAHMCEPGSPKALMDFLYFSEKSDKEFGDSWRYSAPGLAAAFRSAKPEESVAPGQATSGICAPGDISLSGLHRGIME